MSLGSNLCLVVPSVPGSLLKNRGKREPARDEARDLWGPILLYCKRLSTLKKSPPPPTHAFGSTSFIRSKFTPVSAHQSREMALGPQECVGSSALKHWKHSIVPISLLTDQIVNLRAVETSILIIARYSDGSTDYSLPNKKSGNCSYCSWETTLVSFNLRSR